MSTPNPKAFLITTKDLLVGGIDEKDKPHVHCINKHSFLIDGKSGYYLIGSLAGIYDPDFMALPIWESLDGHFTPDTQKWLEARGIEIRRTRA